MDIPVLYNNHMFLRLKIGFQVFAMATDLCCPPVHPMATVRWVLPSSMKLGSRKSMNAVRWRRNLLVRGESSTNLDTWGSSPVRGCNSCT